MERNKETFYRLFTNDKPVIGTINLNGNQYEGQRLWRAIEEINTLIKYDVDGILIHDYFGDENDVESVLAYLFSKHQDLIYGIKLHNYEIAFPLAEKYNAKFIIINSVAGNLTPSHDLNFENKLRELRDKYNILLFGGVRKENQLHLSERSLEEDLEVGKRRCDAIILEGNKEKIKTFREIIGNDFPLISELIPSQNYFEPILISDASIVDALFREEKKEYTHLSDPDISSIMYKIKELRKH